MIEPRTLNEIKARLRQVLPELRGRYPIATLGVFGSWARGEASAESDLDLLVTFDGPIGWEIVTLEDELAERLGLPVDLVLEESLRPYIGAAVRREVTTIWRVFDQQAR